MNKTYSEKLNNLENILKGYGKIALAFSGGVDSTFLLCYASKILGKENVLALTANCMNFARDEISFAKDYAKALGLKHLIIPVDMSKSVEIEPLSSNCDLQCVSLFSDFCNADDEEKTEYDMYSLFDKNPTDRCYYCKKIIFSSLMDYLSCSEEKDFVLCDGTNADDALDYRPGRKALKELSIQSPLELSGLTKAEIRRASKALNIPIWDKPAFACLASRIPYGEAITEAKLLAIYEMEQILQSAGYKQCRVRCHGDLGLSCGDTGGDMGISCSELGGDMGGDMGIYGSDLGGLVEQKMPSPAIARIEVLPEDIARLAADYDLCKKLQIKALVLGFDYCTLDLRGYRMGSLNEVVK